MGGFKEMQKEGLNEIQENTEQTLEVGGEMVEDAGEIDGILEGISLQDDDDMESIRGAKSGYKNSFEGAMSEQVESPAGEIESAGEGLTQEVNAEIENVSSGIESLEEAEGVSEIGGENAEAASGNLEQSKSEYEGVVEQTESTIENLQSEVDSLSSQLEGLFG